MTRFAYKAWLAFGSLLTLSPQRVQYSDRFARIKHELATKNDSEMLVADFKRVGDDMRRAIDKSI